MKKFNYILIILFNVFSISMLIANEWKLEVEIVNVYNSTIPGDYISLGTCDGCNDGFQYGAEDEYDLPDGPMDYSDIQFTNYDWIGTYDSNGIACESPHFFSDYRAEHPPEDLVVWSITGTCADEVEETTHNTQLRWSVDSLAQDLPIFIQIGEDKWDMRYTISRNINCDDLGSNYVQIDGEWIASSNIKVLIGACANQGIDTFYWDADGDGLGSNLVGEYCLDNLPDGWVDNNQDLDDSTFCPSNNFDGCWVCDGGDYLMDCNQVCSPETPNGQVQLNEGLIYGALLDNCGVCSGGSTEHIENSDQDCAGTCFGDAFYDDCEICSGGESNHYENSDQDCAGICFGNASPDWCGECNGENQSCLDQIFGDGPSDFYAQINLDLEEIDLTWNYNNISDQVLGYYIWKQNEENHNLITQIESAQAISYTISGLIEGTFCVSAYDEYGNESLKACNEASEFSNYNFIFNEPSSAYLVSFPYLSNDENGVDVIFEPINEYVNSVIGEGVSSLNIDGFWYGQLTEIVRKKGYWVLTNDDYSSSNPITLSVSGIPTDPNTIYSLHDNANLISYIGPDSVLISDALPDDIEHVFYAIINQGQAATPINGNWYGSLQYFELGKGYWVMVSDEYAPLDLIWNLDNNQQSSDNSDNRIMQRVSPFNFNQSTLQSFYFIDKVNALSFDLDEDDVIISYCNEMIVGSRYYGKGYPDIPAMGYDGDNTIGYCTESDIPNFKIYDTETGRLIDLYGNNIPEWKNLGINRVVLTELDDESIPNAIDIISSFPNPFNPSTKINIFLEEHQNIILSIYDINGKLVETLIDEKLNLGHHSFTWSPENLSSGVYIVSLHTNLGVTTNKVIYLK